MKLGFLIVVSILLSCQNQEKHVKDNVNKKTDSIKLDETEITEQDTIHKSISQKINSAITQKKVFGKDILDDFQMNGDKRETKINDSLFVKFLENFNAYQNNENDLLYKNSKYETWNTLAYSTDNSISKEALNFQDSVKKIGFLVGTNEGDIYLKKDPNFLNKFKPFLSKRMNKFIDQYNIEINIPFLSDASIMISNTEHIRRIIFWEKFAKNHKYFELPSYAESQYINYLSSFMLGTDNSPICDWSDSNKIYVGVIDSYKDVISEYPNSKSAKYLMEYLEYLEQKNFKYDSSLKVDLKEKFPEVFGN